MPDRAVVGVAERKPAHHLVDGQQQEHSQREAEPGVRQADERCAAPVPFSRAPELPGQHHQGRAQREEHPAEEQAHAPAVVSGEAQRDEEHGLEQETGADRSEAQPAPPRRRLRRPQERREKPLGDAEDHAQGEAVNLEVPERRLEGRDLREQDLPARRHHHLPGVPAVQQHLANEAGQREEDEAHPGLEALQAPAEGQRQHACEECRGPELECAPHQCQQRTGSAQGHAHRHRADDDAGQHPPERHETPPAAHEPRVPHGREHLQREAHDEQPHPAIDLRLTVRIDVLDGDAGEPAGDAHLPEQPHAPRGPHGEDGRDGSGEVPVVQRQLNVGRAHRRPPPRALARSRWLASWTTRRRAYSVVRESMGGP